MKDDNETNIRERKKEEKEEMEGERSRRKYIIKVQY